MTEKLNVQEYRTQDGRLIGHLELNKPKALNALDLDMASAMLKQLQSWRNDAEVLLVVISGAGEKAFCAGGDIVSMYQAMQAHKGQVPSFITDFFATEYRLDYTIQTYSKPIVVWGDGIVMGGGIGLFAGASHRIVTRRSRLAMPEITIGLYPDVGASYFLPQSPGKTGLFLGLTGASLNASDACFAGLADYKVDDVNLSQFLTMLTEVHWSSTSVDDHLTTICRQLDNRDVGAQGPLHTYQSVINQLLNAATDATSAVRAILDYDADDEWFKRAQNSLQGGSPITMHLVWEQYHRGSSLSLKDCFMMELVMSCRCAESGEFAEGVRALLIDKDKQPKWQFNDVSAVPAELIERHFTSPWPNNPLADLGE